jgi:hypothetical protein
VRDLNTFSRMDDERTGPVDLEKVLDSSINVAMSHICPQRGWCASTSRSPVLADESRLGQVFLISW